MGENIFVYQYVTWDLTVGIYKDGLMKKQNSLSSTQTIYVASIRVHNIFIPKKEQIRIL